MNTYKDKLLETFKAFDNFCQKNSIKYFASGGTLIGAVRHKGIIPWDDDIDVCMLRDDYNRFIHLTKEAEKTGCSILSLQNSDYALPFAKFWNTNTTLWEIQEIPFVYGVFIDIFPLDYTNLSQKDFLNEYKKWRKWCRIYQLANINVTWKLLSKRICERNWDFLVKDIVSFVIPSFFRKRIRQKLLTIEKKRYLKSGNNIASFCGDYWEREYFQKSWFDGCVKIDFEGMTVSAPIGYHEFLTRVYGDYMELPPKEKQVTHHYHYFLDLDKHYNLDQVKKIIRQR